MLQLRRGLVLGYAVLLLGGTPTMAPARDLASCYDSIATWCAEAMDGEPWYVKVAVGAYCTLLMAGCLLQ